MYVVYEVPFERPRVHSTGYAAHYDYDRRRLKYARRGQTSRAQAVRACPLWKAALGFVIMCAFALMLGWAATGI